MKMISLAFLLLIPLMGCMSVASNGSTPTSVTTAAEAVQADTLVTKAIDAYVLSGMPNRATLVELRALNDGLHKATDALEAAPAAGQSNALAAFNAALAAFNSYATTAGVKH